MSTLAYDALPAGSDLTRELTADGVTITAAIREPSARSIRFIRRAAAFRAIPDCVLGVGIIAFVLMMLLEQLNRGASISPIVYPILSVFIAAIYLLAWKTRFDTAIDLLNVARSQMTILHGTENELRIELNGPRGAASHRVEASEIVGIHPAPMTFGRWWTAELPVLRIDLRDDYFIDLLPGRDDAELEAVAAILRNVLSVPENVFAT